MNCWRLQQIAAAFSDGDLDPKEAREASAHVERCRPCRTLVERVSTVPDLAEPALPSGPCGALMDALEGTILARCSGAQGSAPSEVDRVPVGRTVASRPNIEGMGFLRREVRVPVPAIAAAAAAVVAITFLQAWTWRKVERLEVAQREREVVVRGLETELAGARAGWMANPALAPSANEGWTPVDAVGLPSRQPAWRSTAATGTDGLAFELVSAGGPRVLR